MQDQDKPTIDLQRFRREKMHQWTIVKMLMFLFILLILLSILYFLFKKIQHANHLPKQAPVEQEHRIQVDTTGFRS